MTDGKKMPGFLPFSRPATSVEELAVVKEVPEPGWITAGPKNQALEQAFCQLAGNQHATAASSATAGMHITLIALEIGKGDEVITPSLTWVLTLNMISLLGVTPIMVDADRDTLMATPEAIETVITPRTKAIIPVYYAGAPADIDAIRAIGEHYGIAVIEDAVHAIGTYYKGRYIGAKGTAIFSFHAIKNITCAEGGLIVTDNENLARQLRMLKFHGLGVDAYDRHTWGRVPQAEALTPGYKYNLINANTTIALAQLIKLEHLNIRRREVARRHQQTLAALPFRPLSLPAWPHVHTWHLFIIRVDKQRCGISRDALMEALKERGIGTGLHLRAAHTQEYYRERFPTLSLSNTEQNSERICSLSLFPDMTTADADRVITALQQLTGQRTMFEIHPVKKVSMVIPVYNEQENLSELIRRTTVAYESLGEEYEILLIDDGSSGNSAHMLVEVSQAEGSHIVSVLPNRNYGQHSAIMAGFSHVTDDLVITLDADLQNPPEEIPRLVTKAGEGYDVVGTVRQNRQDSQFRKTASKMINWLVQYITGKAVGDCGCMLHAYRRHVVDAMSHYHERGTSIPILANTFARRAIEIPMHHAERESGESKYSFMRLINLMYDPVACLTTTPLRILSLLGSIIATGGFSTAVLLVILRLTFEPQWMAEDVFMLFTVLFTFIGAQFVGMGLLGEYISRIYTDIRARPRYFVQQVIRPSSEENE